MKLEHLRIDLLDANPYRNMKKYVILKEKLDQLSASFDCTGIWAQLYAKS